VYVTKLTRDVWLLGAPATNTVLRRIGDLIAADALTDASLTSVLHSVGVAESTAALTAPSVRGASIAAG
jgi:hypothetical protein